MSAAARSSDLDSKCEGRVAGILLPTVLAGDRTVADDKSRGAKHHRPEPRQLVITQSTLAPHQIDEQDGKGAFIHLHAGPIGGAIEPAILRPMAVRLLGSFEPKQHAPCILEVARRDERTRRLDKVARPDEVVATEILVAFVEAPRNRETCDDSARERTRLMRANDGGADAIGIGIAARSTERQEAVLPRAPARREIGQRRVHAIIQAGYNTMCRLLRPAAETERQDEFPAARGKIDLARERDIAVFGEVVGPCEHIMPRKVLPSD